MVVGSSYRFCHGITGQQKEWYPSLSGQTPNQPLTPPDSKSEHLD